MKIDKHSNIPMYSQLKDIIVKRIDSGEYPTGSKIPSENELCDEFLLSRPTIRQAVSDLVSEGKLQIYKGKGTFVTASDLIVEIKNFSGFSYSFFNNREVSVNDFKSIEHLKESETDHDIIENFNNIDKSQGFVKITKLLEEKNQTYAFSESYIPVSIFPNLIKDIKESKNMVDITVNKYAYLPAKAHCNIYVKPASSSVSEILDISRGTPVLTGVSVLKSRSEAITEILLLHMRSDICRINI